MADFYKFFPTLLKFEGGYVDDPVDPGGATNKGVTFPVFREHARPLLNVRPTLPALKNLTEEQAARIYKVEYWDKILGDHIEFQPLAEIMFDFYVNAGSHAVVLFYNVLNHAGGHHEKLPWIDISGIRTLAHHDSEVIYMHYKEGRKAYYRTLAHEHPALRKFLRGWLNRVNAFPDFGRPESECK
jgi:lysozyme family protein